MSAKPPNTFCNPVPIGYEPAEEWSDEERFSPTYLRTLFSSDLDPSLLDQPAVPAPTAIGSDQEFALLELYRDQVRNALSAEIWSQDGPWAVPTEFVRRSQPGGNTTFITEAVEYALQQAHVVVMHQKKLFNRARPYQIRPSVQPMFCPGHPSYPSGHSTVAHASAFCLLEIIGTTAKNDLARRGAVMQFALRVARNREIAGVHYPSDTEAGAMLARTVLDALLARDRRFQNLLTQARNEWA